MSSVGTGLTSLCRSPVKPSAVELRDVTWVRLLSAPSLADAGARSRYESILASLYASSFQVWGQDGVE
jgi:hypothetical protein